MLKTTHVLRITDIFMSKCSRKIFENWLKTKSCQERYNYRLHADIFSYDKYKHIIKYTVIWKSSEKTVFKFQGIIVYTSKI